MGDALGRNDGGHVGLKDGFSVGNLEGLRVGDLDGCSVGSLDGSTDGSKDGSAEGEESSNDSAKIILSSASIFLSVFDCVNAIQQMIKINKSKQCMLRIHVKYSLYILFFLILIHHKHEMSLETILKEKNVL